MFTKSKLIVLECMCKIKINLGNISHIEVSNYSAVYISLKYIGNHIKNKSKLRK